MKYRKNKWIFFALSAQLKEDKGIQQIIVISVDDTEFTTKTDEFLKPPTLLSKDYKLEIFFKNKAILFNYNQHFFKKSIILFYYIP